MGERIKHMLYIYVDIEYFELNAFYSIEFVGL